MAGNWHIGDKYKWVDISFGRHIINLLQIY